MSSRKRNLLDDLEYAERLELLRRRHLERIDESLRVYKRVCDADLGSGVKGQLIARIFGDGDVGAAGVGVGAGARDVRKTTTTTTLTHLSASDDGDVDGDDTEAEAEVEDGELLAEAPAPAATGVSAGPVTVAGVAMELGIHDTLSAGGRKGLGKAVSKAYKAEHGGEEPCKFRQPWGRGVRVVNAYGEADRGMIERVARGYIAMREGGCGSGDGSVDGEA